MKTPFLLIVASLFLSVSCSKHTVPSSAGKETTPGAVNIPSAPCIVYKTKKDYSKYVPVGLSEDKSRITSFPGVLDLKRDGKFTYPTPLVSGYLLDNRGIGPDVAFLEITYEEYNSSDQSPQASDLFGKLLEKDPLLEMYRCGNVGDYTDIVGQLNEIIRSGKLGNCIRLK
ncbi:MAG TPA: hypothetical protein VMC08_02285 [Bacteroidales bacterium]|nr:hypothetical protein [Bacteroidales bacterium]